MSHSSGRRACALHEGPPGGWAAARLGRRLTEAPATRPQLPAQFTSDQPAWLPGVCARPLSVHAGTLRAGRGVTAPTRYPSDAAIPTEAPSHADPRRGYSAGKLLPARQRRDGRAPARSHCGYGRKAEIKGSGGGPRSSGSRSRSCPTRAPTQPPRPPPSQRRADHTSQQPPRRAHHTSQQPPRHGLRRRPAEPGARPRPHDPASARPAQVPAAPAPPPATAPTGAAQRPDRRAVPPGRAAGRALGVPTRPPAPRRASRSPGRLPAPFRPGSSAAAGLAHQLMGAAGRRRAAGKRGPRKPARRGWGRGLRNRPCARLADLVVRPPDARSQIPGDRRLGKSDRPPPRRPQPRHLT